VARRLRPRPDAEPWLRKDTQSNRVASADWGENHPGFCYEFGDPNSDPFIPKEVLEAVVSQQVFVVVIWQESAITKVVVEHDPARTFSWRRSQELAQPLEGCDVAQYEMKSRNPVLVNLERNLDPKDVVMELTQALNSPLGYPLEEQSLLPDNSPIERVLVEFSYASETSNAFPLDTGISALSALACHSYLSTIYGSDTV